MAIITGTAGDDTILGLGGNDLIIASAGNDSIDGGAGNDVVDYSNLNGNINFRLGFTESIVTKIPIDGEDKITNIETIIGNPHPTDFNIINSLDLPKGTTMDVDLSKNRATYFNSNSSQTFTVKNFNAIYGGDGNDRLKGNDNDNYIIGDSGDDIIIGSKGNDTLSSGEGKDTLDYSNIGRPITISTSSYVETIPRPTPPVVVTELKVNKGDFGIDRAGASAPIGIPQVYFSIFEKIIGPDEKENTFDASAGNNIASIDINLANNSLKINIPTNPSYIAQSEIVNFVDVIGSKNNDSIVGGNKNSKLTGGGGNDTITGGSNKDRITGSDSISQGVGEVDTLTGGGGRDKFILGDTNGAYYIGKGNNDYATITDFELFKDSISVGSLKNYSFALEGTNTIDLFSGKDVNTRDLIAKIQIAGGISSVGSNSRSIAESSPNLDSIISKIDIGSGFDS
jgi:Ca2+-binding RTX toxin-like protein